MFCIQCGATIGEGSGYCSSCGAPAGTGRASPPPLPGAPPLPAAYGPGPVARAMDYATWSNRVFAYLIDSLLVGGAMIVLYLVAGSLFTGMAALAGGSSSGAAGGMCCLLILMFPVATLLVGFYNRVYLVAQRGYTIGQGVMHLKVVNPAGGLLTQGTAFVRLLAQTALSMIPLVGLLDLLWPLWDDSRQTLHDKAVNCFVINNPGAV